MNFDDRNDIAIAAQFCTRCMSPKYKSKGRSDLLRHSTHECYMSRPGAKNKFTCLNKECTIHSWICTKHKEENKPLYEAHQREFLDKKQSIVFSHICISDSGYKHHYKHNDTTKFSFVTHPQLNPQLRKGPPTRDRKINWVTFDAPLPLAQNLNGQDLTARASPPNTTAHLRDEPPAPPT